VGKAEVGFTGKGVFLGLSWLVDSTPDEGLLHSSTALSVIPAFGKTMLF
jgi:hypothetical protein